jgi:S-DNA-T family DNA segregation ATPase FtsK/SpoIIIE
MATLPVATPRKAVVEKPVNKAPQPSRRAQAEAQPSLAFEESQVEYELPPLGLLTNPASIERHHLSDEALEENARMLENVLDDYGVKGEIVSVRPGPVVTMYELEPAPGLKASRVIGLADDIARSMSALSARVSTVPGRSVIGIELPNVNREKVVLREILASRDFGDSNMSLPLALGKDIGGGSVVANLAKMPHLLIAGTTGSGKSVAINTMILSLLYKLTPDECRLIMIDPKMLELSVYDGIPHLLSPVVTDPKKAVVALKWVVGEMEDRYRKMSKMGVRNIEGYNGRVKEALAKGEMFSRTVQTGFDDETGEPVFETEEFAPKALPFIVVIVDEMADLMMVAGKEIEACIQRLAQMARASGIHLIMATQRPSVDVITGTIKANFPTRISFQVTSKVDSRTILGEMGAEQLLGMGDMLYMAGGAKITRCHGPFCSDEEVEEVVNHLKAFGPPDYVGGVVEGPDDDKADNIDAVLGLNTGGNTDGEDALYDTAVQIVIKDRKCSTSYIQRKLAIGYNKAARLVEQMEDEGLVSPANHVGKREILVPEQS